MKLKLVRTLQSWPDNEYYRRLRHTGARPRRFASVKVIEKNGTPLEGVSGEHQYMPRQLTQDVTSEDYIDLIAQAIEDVACGRIPKWEATGNAWTVMIEPDGAVFEYSIMDGEPGGKVSLETYRKALEAWRDFLADEDCDERILELPDA